MKFLLVFAVVFIAIHIWRRNRRAEEAEAQSRQPPPARPPAAVGPPQAMVRCAHCGLHLPAADALPGPGGVFCSAAHRRAGAA
jgi:uncharacterized protein